MTDSGKLTEHFAFDYPVETDNPDGKVSTTWEKRHEDLVEVIYSRGSEVIAAARLEGRPIFKLRLRSCAPALLITTDWLARDVRRGTKYSIREVDSITDRQWIYIVVEGGKAA